MFELDWILTENQRSFDFGAKMENRNRLLVIYGPCALLLGHDSFAEKAHDLKYNTMKRYIGVLQAPLVQRPPVSRTQWTEITGALKALQPVSTTGHSFPARQLSVI